LGIRLPEKHTMTMPGSFVPTRAEGFEATVARLEAAIADRGIPMLARIDHAGSARSAGLEMPPTMLFVFGDARVGTPLMLASPTIAIDLPLKMLVREDEDGSVSIEFEDPGSMAARHGGLEGHGGIVARMRMLLSDLALQAAGRKP
jgi:uncharacterized protein (DUF302 family)